MGSWNGVGGKLEANETPDECIRREILEETGIPVADVTYKGVVSWVVDGVPKGGMYAFIAEVTDSFHYPTPVKTSEGILDWKELAWICHPQNTGVATNLPKFLPTLFADERLFEFRCIFANGQLQEIVSIPIPAERYPVAGRQASTDPDQIKLQEAKG